MSLLLSIISGVFALVVACFLWVKVVKKDVGNSVMKEIAGYIEEGAMAFLKKEYSYLVVFVIVITALMVIFLNMQLILIQF